MDTIKNTKRIHLIGIGGINVSSIAKLLKSSGFVVSGSDVVATDITRDLEKEGIKISLGQKAENITDDISLVIFTDAIPEDNIERQTAAKKNIRSISAFQFWGEYSKDKKVVAISGTNGKSTTTAMLGLIMEQAKMDPTVVVGTKVLQWNSNIRIGKSDWLVIEADEYHAHMLELNPQLAILTNIMPDHLDYYKDLDDIVAHFQKWIGQMPAGGNLILNKGDQASLKLKPPANLKVKYFSLPQGGLVLEANALAATAAALALDIPLAIITKVLASFKGTWRRFELVGEYNGALVVSDYAHHPDGIRATLEMAKQKYPDQRLVLLYQPHQHNRTRQLFADFVKSFDKCDELILAEIYDVAGRSSAEDKAVSSKDLAAAIKNHPPTLAPRVKARASIPIVSYAPDLVSAEAMVREKVGKGDVLIVMGAGDVDSVARNLVAQ